MPSSEQPVDIKGLTCHLLKEEAARTTGIEVELVVEPSAVLGPRAEDVGLGLSASSRGVRSAPPLSPSRVDVDAAHTFRVAPLLALMPDTDRLLVAAGHVRIQGRGADLPLVTIVVRELWEAPPDGVVLDDEATEPSTVTVWAASASHLDLPELLVKAYNKSSANITFVVAGVGNDVRPASEAEQVTALAKGVAELSRNAVRDLREIRYRMERSLGKALRGSPDSGLNDLLADVVELTLAAGRCRDEAREAAREGLWAWRNPSDEPTYQALRRQMDPTLTSTESMAQARNVPWYRSYEAGVVQSRSMEEQLGEEVMLLHTLLDSAATISVARDAKAQEDFNFVAAVGGVGLGLLALVLALYGATALVPLQGRSYFLLLGPLLLAGLPAAALAMFLRRDRPRSWWQFAIVLGFVILALAILAVAGTFVPEAEVAPTPTYIVPSPGTAP